MIDPEISKDLTITFTDSNLKSSVEQMNKSFEEMKKVIIVSGYHSGKSALLNLSPFLRNFDQIKKVPQRYLILDIDYSQVEERILKMIKEGSFCVKKAEGSLKKALNARLLEERTKKFEEEDSGVYSKKQSKRWSNKPPKFVRSLKCIK